MNDDRPNVTGGDLFALSKIANQYIPGIAEMLTEAHQLLSDTAATAGDAFSHDDDVGREPEPHWQNLRAELTAILACNAERLINAGHAVSFAIEAFTDTDSANASGIVSVSPEAVADLQSYEDSSVLANADSDDNVTDARDSSGHNAEEPIVRHDLPEAPSIPTRANDYP